MSVSAGHLPSEMSQPKQLRKEVAMLEMRREKGAWREDMHDSGFSDCSTMSARFDSVRFDSTRRLVDDDGYGSMQFGEEEPMSGVHAPAPSTTLEGIVERADHVDQAPVAEHVASTQPFVASAFTSAIRQAMTTEQQPAPVERTEMYTENTHYHNFACSGDALYLLAPFRDLLSTPNDDGDTALHLSVINGRVAVVDQLLTVRPNDFEWLDQVNFLGQTALHIAVITNHLEIVGMLLSAGADPTKVDRNGNSPLHLAAKAGLCECARLIVQACERRRLRRRDLLEQRNFEGLTALHLAAFSAHEEMMVFLVNEGADVDAQDYSCGRSVLHHAVEKNQLSTASALLFQLGADVNASTYDGNTPLHSAAGLGLCDMVAVLVASGADFNVKNAEGDRPIDVSSSEQVISILQRS